MKKVTIIVPVYNAAADLPACLDSILRQTYPNMELIIVNDGSTDASLQVATHYQQRDNRVVVLNQPNGGPGSARNKGLEAVTGSFVQFVDADDTLVPNATATLVRQMKDSTDLVVCTYEKDGNIKTLPIKAGEYAKREFLEHIGTLYAATLLPSPCNKLYRHSLIESQGIKFPEQTNYGEDLLFNLAYLAHCNIICCINQALYRYQTREGSLTNSSIPHLFPQQKKLQQTLQHFLQKEDCVTEKNRIALQQTFAKDSLYAATNLFHPDNLTENKREVLKQMMQDPDVRACINYLSPSVQGRLWQYVIRRQSYTLATLLFRTKAWLKGRFS